MLRFWERTVLGWFWRLLVWLAADVTDGSDTHSALVLAPHPDDESLGCGGSIARKRAAGTPVWILVATDGSRSHSSARVMPFELARIRRDEVMAACAVLGVDESDVTLLGFEDSTLARQSEQLARRVREELLARRPQDLLVPSRFDGHPDHRVLNAAAREAVADLGLDVRLLEYPVWFATAAAWTDPGRSRMVQAWQLISGPLRLLRTTRPCAVDIGPFRALKRRAIAAHKSQTTRLTGEPGWAVLEPAFLERFSGVRELFFVSRSRRLGFVSGCGGPSA